MKKFLLVDTLNLMWRAAHVTRGDAYTRTGLALHIMLQSLPNVSNKFDIDHVIFVFEGTSWRKKFDKSYKLNRKVIDANLSVDDKEYKEMMLAAMQDLKDLISTSTNASVLQHEQLEADDLIAGWIQTHPQDSHIILSSDSDFKQLLAHNVKIYNGIDKTTLTDQYHYDERGNIKKDKNGNIIEVPSTEYFLFEKIIRGDSSDNIKSAYPGVRKKGTKNKFIQIF